MGYGFFLNATERKAIRRSFGVPRQTDLGLEFLEVIEQLKALIVS